MSDILDSEEVRFKYNVTVSPTNGVDNETCYPSGEYRRSNVPCQSLNFALKIDHRKYIMFYLADPNQTYYLDTEKITFVNGNYVGFFGANTSYPRQAKIHCVGNASLSFVNFNNVIFRMVQFVHCGGWRSSTSIDMTKTSAVAEDMNCTILLQLHGCYNEPCTSDTQFPINGGCDV